MEITVHDNRMKQTAFLSNDLPETLHFYNDQWHRYLAESTSTFDFTVSKFQNGKLHNDCKYLVDSAYFSITYKGYDELFYIADMTESDYYIDFKCNNLNLELQKEEANPFSTTESHTLEWYTNAMDLLNFTKITINVNELSNSSLALTFDQQETKLARLISLIGKFGGEHRFRTILNKDGSFNTIQLDIFHENDDSHQGVGQLRGDVTLVKGKNITGVTMTSSKSAADFYNMTVTTGADGLNIADKVKTVYNANGDIEFYTVAGNPSVYAPLAVKLYPSTTKVAEDDEWIRKDFSTDYTDSDALMDYTFSQIKKYAYPQITYTVLGTSSLVGDNLGLDLGDTISMQDDNFVDGLILQMRVVEQIISFTNPANNQYVFSNFKKQQSELSSGLQERLSQLVSQAQPYELLAFTDNGTQFKNDTGTSTINLKLQKDGSDISGATFKFMQNDIVIANNNHFTVDAKKMYGYKAVIDMYAYVDDIQVAYQQITFTSVFDGISPVLMVIKSSSGNIFKNNIISTNLTATLWKDNQEIDKEGNSFAYVWTKFNFDGTEDTAWNLQHRVSQKTIAITQSDIWQRATFDCDASIIL